MKTLLICILIIVSCLYLLYNKNLMDEETNQIVKKAVVEVYIKAYRQGQIDFQKGKIKYQVKNDTVLAIDSILP